MANLLKTTAQASQFTTLMNGIETAQLTDLLQGEGPFTILAPTDEAFDQLPKALLDTLLSDTHKLKEVLLYHVLSGDVRSDDLAEISEAPTLEGSVMIVEHDNGTVKVNQAQVIQFDILTDNGVIHAIDSVLMPAMTEAALTRAAQD